MNAKRMVIAFALLGLFAIGPAIPKPAHAATSSTSSSGSSITTALIIAGVVVGAYLAAVFIATEVHRRSRGPFELMPAGQSAPRKQEEPRVRFGLRCAQRSTTLTMVCW
jgi:hypothetical protein